MQKILIKTVS